MQILTQAAAESKRIINIRAVELNIDDCIKKARILANSNNFLEKFPECTINEVEKGLAYFFAAMELVEQDIYAESLTQVEAYELTDAFRIDCDVERVIEVCMIFSNLLQAERKAGGTHE